MKHHDKPPTPTSFLYHAEHAEAAICAYLMRDPERCFPEVREAGVNRDKFQNPMWRQLFDVLAELHDSGNSMAITAEDWKVLVSELQRRGLESLYGPRCHMVLSLWIEYGTYMDALELWVYQLNDSHARRVASEMVEGSLDVIRDPKVANPEVRRTLVETAEYLDQHTEPATMASGHDDLAQGFIESLEAKIRGEDPRSGTGISILDEKSGGLKPHDLFIFAAGSGKGKSVMMIQAAIGAMRESRIKTLICSLELSRNEVFQRILSCGYGVDYGFLTRRVDEEHPLTQHEIQSIKEAMTSATRERLPYSICDIGEMGLPQLDSQISRLRPGLVILDYLGLMKEVQERGRGTTREETLVEMSNALKGMAKRHNTAIITAHQLNDDGKLYAARGVKNACDLLMVITDNGVAFPKTRSSQITENLYPFKLNGRFQRFDWDQD